jgi:DNA-damage-inducible protein J
MSANTIVRARINEEIKKEASIVLAEIGLTISDVFRMLLIRVAREKSLPFEPLIPNIKTIEAIKASRRGDLVTIGNLDNLLTELNAKD